jgi:hypothetical protein
VRHAQHAIDVGFEFGLPISAERERGDPGKVGAGARFRVADPGVCPRAGVALIAAKSRTSKIARTRNMGLPPLGAW